MKIIVYKFNPYKDFSYFSNEKKVLIDDVIYEFENSFRFNRNRNKNKNLNFEC